MTRQKRNTDRPFRPSQVEGTSTGKLLWPADRIERWSVDRLIPYARNARTHDEHQGSGRHEQPDNYQGFGHGEQSCDGTRPILVGFNETSNLVDELIHAAPRHSDAVSYLVLEAPRGAVPSISPKE